MNPKQIERTDGIQEAEVKQIDPQEIIDRLERLMEYFEKNFKKPHCEQDKAISHLDRKRDV